MKHFALRDGVQCVKLTSRERVWRICRFDMAVSAPSSRGTYSWWPACGKATAASYGSASC